MANEHVRDVGDRSFEEEVLQSSTPVLVDFWAAWCAPCRAIGPLIDEMAETYQGQLKVVKFNIENDVQVPQRYGITAIPTLLLFKGGTVVNAITGAPPKGELVKAIGRVLAPG